MLRSSCDDRLIAHLQLASNALELPAQVTELVVPEILHLGVEITARDPVGGLDERLRRPGERACQEEADEGDRREQDGQLDEDGAEKRIERRVGLGRVAFDDHDPVQTGHVDWRRGRERLDAEVVRDRPEELLALGRRGHRLVVDRLQQHR